ncbi:glycoside hydrolase xylanase [Leptospira sp. WS92.C1]
MKKKFKILILIIFLSLLANCFLNPLSQAVTSEALPSKEDCKDCTEQQLVALAAVIQSGADGIQTFSFDLSSFLQSGECANGVCPGGISEATASITATVPDIIIRSGLKATFVIPENSKLEVGGVLQVSGVTANDFLSPVTYVYTNGQGAVKNYTVSVPLASPGDNVNGTVVLIYSGSLVYWTKCSYGQLYRPGFNDCQGKGNSFDDYGAITTTLPFCNTADTSCDDEFSLTSGPLISACQSMENDIPAMKALPGFYAPITLPTEGHYVGGAGGALFQGCAGFTPVDPCTASGNACPAASGLLIDTSLFPETVPGDYWTQRACTETTAAKVSMIAPGAANTSLKNLIGTGSPKAIRCIRRNMS